MRAMADMDGTDARVRARIIYEHFDELDHIGEIVPAETFTAAFREACEGADGLDPLVPSDLLAYSIHRSFGCDLAEVLRVQIFLRYAGSPLHAADLLTWTQLEETGWVRDRVEELMAHAGTAPAHDIRVVWVEDQRSCHERAAARSTRDQAASKRVVKLAFWLSIAFYVAAFVFELACGDLTSAPLFPIDPVEPVRAGLKIALGSVSAATLFIGSYYDKSSFSRVHEDHIKVERFFAWAGSQLDACGQCAELLERIAREELIENGNWYSYQLEGASDPVL